MSRKTPSHKLKNAITKPRRPVDLVHAGARERGQPGLAHSSMSLGFGGIAHTQNVPTRKRPDQPTRPASTARVKRRGLKATPLASTGTFSRIGASLKAQNSASAARAVTRLAEQTAPTFRMVRQAPSLCP